jgi:hypothetical protein
VTLFAKVEAVFHVPGRGTVIVPAFLSDLRVPVGSPIQLRVPDGKVRDTYITAVEFLSGLGSSRLAFMLPRDVEKQDVPEGTEIWLAEIQEPQGTP